MIHYPLKFSGTSEAQFGNKQPWHSKASGHDVDADISPEFHGQGQSASPEDLFLLSAVNCYIATFKVFAERRDLTFDTVHVDSELTVDRGGGDAFPWMSHLHLDVKLKGASDKVLAEKILREACKSCLVFNSIKTDVSFDFSFE